MSLPGYPADWPEMPGVRTWQTIRDGGVSRDAWSSLNLGTHVGDAPDDVTENRRRLVSELDLPSAPVWLEQVHGSRILHVDKGETGPADGAVTSMAGQVLCIMTADCLPILFAALNGSAIGCAHAGWRGLASGVIEATVAAMARPPDQLAAWLGPAISQPAFEVGDEVREAFVVQAAADADAFERNARGRWQADLYALARARLQRCGVQAVFGNPQCTWANSGRYFSHRRHAPCGRLASLIWRDP